MVGHEKHSTMFDMTVVRKLLNDAKMEPVVLDLGSLGAISPKTTALYASPTLLIPLDSVLGSVRLAAPSGADVMTVGYPKLRSLPNTLCPSC